MPRPASKPPLLPRAKPLPAAQVVLRVGGLLAGRYDRDDVGVEAYRVRGDGNQHRDYAVVSPSVSVFVGPSGRHRQEGLWVEVGGGHLRVSRLVGENTWDTLYEVPIENPQVTMIVNKGATGEPA